MELIVEEVDAAKLRVNSNVSTPRRVLPLSDHLQTIVEKSSDVEPTDLEVPTTDQSPSNRRACLDRDWRNISRGNSYRRRFPEEILTLGGNLTRKGLVGKSYGEDCRENLFRRMLPEKILTPQRKSYQERTTGTSLIEKTAGE